MSVYPTTVPNWGNRLSLQTNAAGAWMPITDEVTAIASRTMGRFMLNAYAMTGATVGPNDNTLALNNSDAFRQAAKAAWLAGGGIVTFPSGGGRYYMRPLTGVGDTSGKAVGSKQTRALDGLQGPDGAGSGAGGTFSARACMVLLPGVWVDLNGAEVIVENGFGSTLNADGGDIFNYIACTLGQDSNQGATSDIRIFNGRLNGNAANSHPNLKVQNGLYFTNASNCVAHDLEIFDCYGSDGGGSHTTSNGSVSFESFGVKAQTSNNVTFKRLHAYVTNTTGTRGAASMSCGITWSYSSFGRVIDCVAHNIKAANGTSGNGFSSFASNSIYYDSCWAYSNRMKGFNQEGGSDIRYNNCLAGGISSYDTRQPFGGSVSVGNGGGDTLNFGWYITANQSGTWRQGLTTFRNCSAVGNNQRNVGLNTVRQIPWSSQSGTGPFTTVVAPDTSKTPAQWTFSTWEGPTVAGGKDGAYILVVDGTTYMPKGPVCRIASYVSSTSVTTNQNPTLYAAGASTDFVVVISGLVDIDGMLIANGVAGIDNTTSGNASGVYQGLATRLRNVRFDNNSSYDIGGGWNGLNGSSTTMASPFGIMTKQDGTAITQMAVPASGALLYNPFPYDCLVYIYSNQCTWGASGIQLRTAFTHLADTVTSGSNQTQTILTPDTTALCKDTLSVLVPQGAGIVLNYSVNTPTWKWVSTL